MSETTMQRIIVSGIAVGSLMLGLLVVAAPPAAAQKSIEQYRANAMVQASPGAGRASTVEVNIYRWSEESEREEILDAVKEATGGRPNNRLVAQALRGQKKAGWAFMTGQQGWPIRYSRQIDMPDGKRRLVLATDRPVSFDEAYSGSRLGDFDVTIIVLDVDADGNGEGVLSLGTEVIWNNSENKLEITNVSSQPIKLGNVRPR